MTATASASARSDATPPAIAQARLASAPRQSDSAARERRYARAIEGFLASRIRARGRELRRREGRRMADG